MRGKEYFIPRLAAPAEEKKAACKQIGAHVAAIITMEDALAVKEILSECTYVTERSP